MAAIGELSPDVIGNYSAMIPRRFFDEAPEGSSFRFFGILSGDTPSGVLVLQTRADLAQIRYIYLVPELRGTGCLADLLTEVQMDMRAEGLNEMICTIVPAVTPSVIRVLTRSGFRFTDTDRAFFRFPAKRLRKGIIPASQDWNRHLIPFHKLPVSVQDRMTGRVRSGGYLLDIKSLPEEKTKGSMVYMEGENPRGMLLLIRMEDPTDPAEESLDMGLFYISSDRNGVTLALLNSLVETIAGLTDQEQMITGYFPEAAPVHLLEHVLGVKAQREQLAVCSLEKLDRYRNEVEAEIG